MNTFMITVILLFKRILMDLLKHNVCIVKKLLTVLFENKSELYKLNEKNKIFSIMLFKKNVN